MQLELFSSNNDVHLTDKYTTERRTPQYVPSNTKPMLQELYNATKYASMLREIRQADIPQEEKDFLMLAASRHIVFNYSKIADYYAHSSKEVQELMEKSALVIVDVDDAIANGYVKLSSSLTEILNATLAGDENEG